MTDDIIATPPKYHKGLIVAYYAGCVIVFGFLFFSFHEFSGITSRYFELADVFDRDYSPVLGLIEGVGDDDLRSEIVVWYFLAILYWHACIKHMNRLIPYWGGVLIRKLNDKLSEKQKS